MTDKKKTIKEQAENIRKDLDELIGNDAEPIKDIVETDPPMSPIRQVEKLPSYPELKEASIKKAKKTITSLMKFYLDEDIIESDEYIQSKKSIDEMTMSSLVYQLQAGERALTILLQTIEDGDIAPRMFEVLATLQKSMLDIIKSQTMYLMATEESTKRIARDVEIYRKKGNEKELNDSGEDSKDSTTQRGTKDLMKMIQSGIDKADIEDVEAKDNTEEDNE